MTEVRQAARLRVVPEISFRSPSALTTRPFDFWLLGGASLLMWLVMINVEGFRDNWAIDHHFKNLTYTTASLSLLVNYPHFMMSYKLAYSRGRGFVHLHWLQLVAVPLLLVSIFAVAFIAFDVPVANLPFLNWLRRACAECGNNGRVLSGPRLGDLLFTIAFNVMLLTVGWHYTKQVFGCMMVYAHFDSYRLSERQRNLIRWSLLSFWGLNFSSNNAHGSQFTFSEFTYYSLDLPDLAVPLAGAFAAAGFIATAYGVFYINYRDHGFLPSVNLLVPFLALYVWWLPQTRQSEFYFLLTPLFHSLQYLAFVYKIEDARLRAVRHREIRATIVVVGAVLAGWLAFEILPNALDNEMRTYSVWHIFFFFTAAMLFINIHHYFLDSVLWRFRDAAVRTHLLS